jgi:Na+-translocating ferredoxin:NAD+ oxidoreductase RnfD subunit
MLSSLFSSGFFAGAFSALTVAVPVADPKPEGLVVGGLCAVCAIAMFFIRRATRKDINRAQARGFVIE